jgi:hypothetical protein
MSDSLMIAIESPAARVTREERGTMVNVLGVEDPWVWGGYLLAIISTTACVIYGWLYWNKGGEEEEKEE